MQTWLVDAACSAAAAFADAAVYLYTTAKAIEIPIEVSESLTFLLDQTLLLEAVAVLVFIWFFTCARFRLFRPFLDRRDVGALSRKEVDSIATRRFPAPSPVGKVSGNSTTNDKTSTTTTAANGKGAGNKTSGSKGSKHAKTPGQFA